MKSGLSNRIYFSGLFQIYNLNESTPVMKLSLCFLANPTAVGSTKGLKPAPLALLPPIPLYRRLLRGHRNFLPQQMRVLGDEYVKSEFRSHREVENPMHIVRFRRRLHWYPKKLISRLIIVKDWLPDRVADVCSTNRRGLLAWREIGQGQD